MHEKKAKIVCLVPSWTETLLEANLNVVGRTRFCIHPIDKVGSIPIVGGTKNLKIEEIIALKPDFVILDKEENKKEMATVLMEHKIEILVSHVLNLATAADFLDVLAEKFSNTQLADFADMYRVIEVNKKKLSPQKFFAEMILQKNSELEPDNLDYVIWNKPFMVIGQNTFIAAVFELIGVCFDRPDKYPKVSATELINRCCLFSTEPYPFLREFSELTAQGFKGALVDGEKISWYGIRNLIFLKSCFY